MPTAALVEALCCRTVEEAFRAHPDWGRARGDHRFDGVLPDAGADAASRRRAQLAALAAQFDAAAGPGELGAAARADLLSARLHVAAELFSLEQLRAPWTDPRAAVDAGADVSGYVHHAYAPAARRADGLCRQLEGLADWFEASASVLEPEVSAGPHAIALDSLRGHAEFYETEVRDAFGELGDGALARRLERAVRLGIEACEAQRLRLVRLRPSASMVLGADRFCAMLEAQEGVRETVASLRARVDAELARLASLAEELSAELSGGGLPGAVARMEEDRCSAGGLLSSVASMVDGLRRFWMGSGAVTVPGGVSCDVHPTPAFYRWAGAAYEPPGPLDPPGLPHRFYVTTVQPDWSDEQAEQWLRYLNLPSLENMIVHEVYPGHFVHELHGVGQPNVVRRLFWTQGFGEGWAHYAEELAIEQGLAEGRPLLRLAQLQDALCRACRFRAAVGIHCEGMPLEEATRLFVERAAMPAHPAQREALRATFDPMYLTYTYGKLEIQRWRGLLERRPGWSLRRFHDSLLATGFPPLAAVETAVLGGGAPTA